ncbi:hypothetical protein ACFVGV_06165 [Pseudarthrobacter scleromae]|uniref:hypothetical protein n=1 Tax=Pseudarthrobacter scleromae TaxID=158897 RepID=UPI00362A96B2
MSSLNDIQIAAINSLRNYLKGAEDEKTAHLRAVATSFVDARQHFFTPQGEPDWLGRTHAYRTWVRETMRLADVQQSNLTTVQAAIRYHIGNIVRERMDADTIQGLGLRSSSPKQRSVEKRGRHSEVLNIFGNGGAEIVDPDEIVVAVGMMEAALARMSVEAIAGMDAQTRKTIREAIEGVELRLHDLAAAAGSRRK